ncbi:hypothetical protein PXK00_04525 [Phaeobacter sp. QD34_3]|uniref:hypothetical protein n=1 Tax=unclassified Phaeobacter TaxID=2621772 RepID=UPI00237EF819|nr:MULTISPECIES: hypothetical protein [unclassified Phaeobacter]MDE4132362.1 hypothetical protein [Phaeobacter sp. QD34_3]MDE4136000.1 hypothetical protein [Phaeobacter sp. QD34_24]
MTRFSSVLFQLSGVEPARLSGLGHDLLIVETGLRSTAVSPHFTSADLAALHRENTTAIGYLNMAVTDHNRDYWQADWTVGGPADNPDMGAINPNADVPDWLQNAHGTAADFGRIVDYSDPDWLATVLAPYAADIVVAGFGGLFLDDVAQYYQAADQSDGSYAQWEAARDMMQLVVDLAEVLERDHGIDAEALTLVMNGGPFIISDYIFARPEDETSAIDYDLINRYRALVDGLVIENVTESDFGFWRTARDWFNGTGPGASVAGQAFQEDQTDLMALETAGWIDNIGRLLSRLDRIGAEVFIARDPGYDAALTPERIGTAGADRLRGDITDDVLIGLGHADILRGRGGDDIIFGGRGDDVIYGSAGDDIIFAGGGNDTIYGGGGNDIIIGGAGRDVIHGGRGRDSLVGGTGEDLVNGGRGLNEVYQDSPAQTVLDDWFI